MTIRQRLLNGTDRVIAIVLVALLAGTTLAFGGAVWWMPTATAGLTVLFVLMWLIHVALEGRMRILKSPLTFLGLMAVGLGVAQLAPLPGPIASRLSTKARQVYAQGFFADRAQAIDPSVELPEGALLRSPVSLDRAATLRWVVGAVICLGIFWGASQFIDRLERFYLILGSLVAVFLLNTSFGIAQVACNASGLYGNMEPGSGAAWSPTLHDYLKAPNATVLRVGTSAGKPPITWTESIPERPFLMGTLMGGTAAYLALASIALPLSFGILLQIIAPRGSRERIAVRLSESGQSGLALLLTSMLFCSTALVGFLVDPISSLPFAIALVLVGIPGARASGLRWTAVGLTMFMLLGIGMGLLLRNLLERIPGAMPEIGTANLYTASHVWRDALRIIRDFPILGVGVGGFGTVYPFYKSQDESVSTALSSLLQWWAESGAIGMLILAVALLWCLWRLPKAIRSVGTADRSLVFGLIGAAVGLSLYATIHWTVELTAVAIAASVLGGTCNRWLAGGTDLFVERG
ncbi:O-antigen ligase domain-containing protein [Singulisphaera sp. PoT]|uniref:O-antigen ligase domain-containing protein n=1 Tax=Singulisphaera sp. PoT TaxID=3411797 RepID=UPI003BF60CAF